LRRDHRINPSRGGRSESLSSAAAHRINALWISASFRQKNIEHQTMFDSTTDQAKIRKPLSPQKQKEENKSHKYLLGLSLYFLSVLSPLRSSCVFVVKLDSLKCLWSL
jgi:hypothetical protein